MSEENRRQYMKKYMRRRRAGESSVVKPVDVKYKNLNWQPIKFYPGYEVSDDGHVRSLQRVKMRNNGRPHTTPERVLKQNIDSNGYCQVGMYNQNSKKKSLLVHRLVWEAFNGPTDLDLHHIDHDPLNNRLDNLEAVTRIEHQQRYIDDLEQKAYERGYKAATDKAYNLGYHNGYRVGREGQRLRDISIPMTIDTRTKLN